MPRVVIEALGIKPDISRSRIKGPKPLEHYDDAVRLVQMSDKPKGIPSIYHPHFGRFNIHGFWIDIVTCIAKRLMPYVLTFSPELPCSKDEQEEALGREKVSYINKCLNLIITVIELSMVIDTKTCVEYSFHVSHHLKHDLLASRSTSSSGYVESLNSICQNAEDFIEALELHEWHDELNEVTSAQEGEIKVKSRLQSLSETQDMATTNLVKMGVERYKVGPSEFDRLVREEMEKVIAEDGGDRSSFH
jgi:hypothetical protein